MNGVAADSRLSAYPDPRPSEAATPVAQAEEALQRCETLMGRLPPMEGSVKYERSWGIEESLEQFQGLVRQHELQSSVGQSHVTVRKMHTEFCTLSAMDVARLAREALKTTDPQLKVKALEEVKVATRRLRRSMQVRQMKELQSAEKVTQMEEEIRKSNAEMTRLPRKDASG
eukprot:symbB.v1.2.021618.t1/scaffold1857.1/size167749/8